MWPALVADLRAPKRDAARGAEYHQSAVCNRRADGPAHPRLCGQRAGCAKRIEEGVRPGGKGDRRLFRKTRHCGLARRQVDVSRLTIHGLQPRPPAQT